jgi:hypothetical protein
MAAVVAVVAVVAVEEAHVMDTKRRGSAMLELMIGLVTIIALFAGLVQIVSLSEARHATHVEARRLAGRYALRDVGSGMGQLSDADYISDWDPGADGRRHTYDDSASGGSPWSFSDDIVQYSSPDSAGWTIIQQAAGDHLSPLLGQPNPAALFGLVEGEAHATVELLPAVKSLLYDADSIEVESRVWMTWTKGIY